MNSDTIIKDLGNDIYEISVSCGFFTKFLIKEHLPVGEFANSGHEIVSCSTDFQILSLSVGFSCKIIEVNQEFIDYTHQMIGKYFSSGANSPTGKFAHTDWICRVQKLSYAEEDPNPHKISYKENPYSQFGEIKLYDFTRKIYDNVPIQRVLANTWQKYLTPYSSEIGFFNQHLPFDVYVRNFRILSENIKKYEPFISFEYYPNYSLHSDKVEKWELAEQYKRPVYLYAPYDIETFSFNEKLLAEAQYNPQPNGWVLINIRKDNILKIERKIHYYFSGFGWYKPEGELIRIGLDTKGDYIRVHSPCYPMAFAPVGKVLKENDGESLAEIDVEGPMMVWLSAEFDMEVVEVNTKVWNDSQLGEPCELLEEDPFGEGWLFVVRPLDAEKTKKLFGQWKENGQIE